MELQSIKQRFGIIGNAPALNNALDIAIRVAPTNLSVLINWRKWCWERSFLTDYTSTFVEEA
jgi:hypothetical protein